jgi:hypothetical protein
MERGRSVGSFPLSAVIRTVNPFGGEFSGLKVAYLGTQRGLEVFLEVFNGLPDGKQNPDAT